MIPREFRAILVANASDAASMFAFAARESGSGGGGGVLGLLVVSLVKTSLFVGFLESCWFKFLEESQPGKTKLRRRE